MAIIALSTFRRLVSGSEPLRRSSHSIADSISMVSAPTSRSSGSERSISSWISCCVWPRRRAKRGRRYGNGSFRPPSQRFTVERSILSTAARDSWVKPAALRAATRAERRCTRGTSASPHRDSTIGIDAVPAGGRPRCDISTTELSLLCSGPDGPETVCSGSRIRRRFRHVVRNPQSRGDAFPCADAGCIHSVGPTASRLARGLSARRQCACPAGASRRIPFASSSSG